MIHPNKRIKRYNFQVLITLVNNTCLGFRQYFLQALLPQERATWRWDQGSDERRVRDCGRLVGARTGSRARAQGVCEGPGGFGADAKPGRGMTPGPLVP